MLYFAEALFFNSVLAFRDLSRYFYPIRFFTINSIKAGILPLWNPYIFCGTPHLALQQSVIFYPLSIIYYMLPYDLAFNMFLIAHMFLAGVFIYLLGRRWHVNSSAALLSAIVFMFSGYIVSVLNLATTLSSVIWLPLVVLFFDRALEKRTLKDYSIAAVFLAVMFLGGEPSIFYTTLWVLLFYAFFFWLHEKRYSAKNISASFLLMVSLAVLISSIQFFPFLELMKFADRTASNPSYDLLTKWSLPLKDTVSFIIPFFARTDFSEGSYWKEQNWVILIYVGVFSVFLMLLALLFKKGWRVRFLLFIGALFLLISYGSNTPFYYFVYKAIPGFKFIRYPVRFLYVTTFAISMLCGAGFDAYLEGRKSGDGRLKVFFKRLLIPLYLFSIIFLFIHLYKNGIISQAREFCVRCLDPGKEGGVLYAFIAAVLNIKRLLGFFLAGGLLLFLGLRLKMRQGVISFALISLITIDLFSNGTQLVLDANAIHSAQPNIEYLKRDKGLFRFFVSPKTKESNYFLRGDTFENAVEVTRDRLLPDWPVIEGLYDTSGYDSMRLASYSKVMSLAETAPGPSDTRVLDMLNTKYLVVLDELDDKGYKLVRRSEGSSSYLYEDVNYLPRAFLAGSFKVLDKEEEIAAVLKSKEFDPRKEVILEEEPVLGHQVTRSWFDRLTIPRTIPSGAEGPSHQIKEAVEITVYSPNEVIIKAAVDSPKFLVLSDSYYPGWKVYVDGKRERLYKANYMLRAVYLGAGTHIVRFIFDPFTFKSGLIVSALTLLILLFYIVYKRI